MVGPFGPSPVERPVHPARERTEHPEIDPEVAVGCLLAMAHLDPSKEEIANFTAGLVAARTAVRKLYAVPEARYEEPALIFRARL